MERFRKYKGIDFLYCHAEEIYMIFALSLFGVMSIGKNSTHTIFKMVLPVALIACFVKFIITTYTKQEWFWLFLVGGLFGINYCINREQDLLYCFLLIATAKGVNLDRVLRYAFWIRLVLTTINVSLVLLGIIPNSLHALMPKYMNGQWESVNLYTYGYSHPNHTYFNLFTIVLLGLYVYRKMVKWYHFVVLTCIMYLGYRVILCRTGWYMWIVAFILFAFYYIISKTHFKKIYMYAVMSIPFWMASFSLFGVYLYKDFLNNGNKWGELLNSVFTGRFGLVQPYIPQLQTAILGKCPAISEDLAYIWIIYNYGWIVFGIVLVSYSLTIRKLVMWHEDIPAILLAIVSGYALAERLPLNGGWNLMVILVSIVLFKDITLGDNICEKF